MYKLLLVFVALSVTVAAQGIQTEDLCVTADGNYCFTINGEMFAYINFTRQDCSDYWGFQLIRTLDNGNELILGGGKVWPWSWEETFIFGAGTGFVTYLTINEPLMIHHNRELTFPFSTLRVPSISEDTFRFPSFTVAGPDNCRTENQTSVPCDAANNYDYNYGESPNSFYTIQDYIPGESTTLKPYILSGQNSCVYLIPSTDNAPPLHSAPVVCYTPKMKTCDPNGPVTVASNAGLRFVLPLTYGSDNVVTLNIDGILSVDLQFNFPWYQAPIGKSRSPTMGYTVKAILYNSGVVVADSALSQDFYFPGCGLSWCQTSAGWSSSSDWSSGSSGWSSSSDWSSGGDDDDDNEAGFLLWLLGGVFLFSTALIIGGIVFIAVYAKKNQYQPVSIPLENL